MTSSGISYTAYGVWSAYGCAKSAMNHLCLVWPKEEPDIGIVCLTPGIVESGIQRECREEGR
jgi:NAD(P)-dependent dehydrogenase (short-subunit alcohol dehydrogenase family)